MNAQLSLLAPPTTVRASSIRPRDYQVAAKTAICERWAAGHRRASVELPTGTGKTTLFGLLCKELLAESYRHRILVLAHRFELIGQATARLSEMTGVIVDREQASRQASVTARLVAGSVQTLRGARLREWPKDHFTHIIVDESHHEAAAGYKNILAHFESAKVAGFSATLDRLDKRSVLQSPEELVHRMTIEEAIEQGWLVPIVMRHVHIEEMGFESVGVTRGDLNPAQQDAVMKQEAILHQIARPVVEEAGSKRILVFGGPGVATCQRLAEIMNRYRDGFAREINGDTEPGLRARDFAAHRASEYPALCNVDIATEGYDDPGIEVVVLGRKTMSRSKFAQMAGRALRPLCKVDDYATAAERRAAIARSSKAEAILYDFGGNSRHDLASPIDLLSGNYSAAVVKRAKAKAEKQKAGKVDVKAALEAAKGEVEREEARKAEAKARKAVKAALKWRTTSSDPFKRMGGEYPEVAQGTRLATPGMVNVLRKNGLEPPPQGWGYDWAKKACGRIAERRTAGLCSPRQIAFLKPRIEPHGIVARDLSAADAGRLVGALKANQRAGYGYRFMPGQLETLTGRLR